MDSIKFYLVGDHPSTARVVASKPIHKLESLRKVAADVFHVIQQSGVSFHTGATELLTVDDILVSDGPIGIKVNGQPVREPQGPQGLPVAGSLYEIFPDHLGNHSRLFRRYGAVIKTTILGKTTYLTDSPEVAGIVFNESIYFTKMITPDHPLWAIKNDAALFIGDTETENWRLAHKFIPPSMSAKAICHYTPMMRQCVRSSFAVFDALEQSEQAWNVYHYMVKLASQTIAKFTLNLDLCHFDSVVAPLHPIVTSIAGSLALNKKVADRGAWYRRLPFGDPARLKYVTRAAYSIIEQAVDNAAREGGPDLPLNEAASGASCVVDYLLRAVDDKGQKLPSSLVLPNMLVVTGAGFTTTSGLLSWLIYALVTYPGVQDRLLQDLIDFGFDGGTDSASELVHHIPYLHKFIQETQRLHNPSFQPARTTKIEVVLPGGYRLPANSVIVPAIHAIHTNPHVWHDPFRFDPDRWDKDEVKNRHYCAYVPFGVGPRGCIGFNFALQEVKVAISELVYRYEFSRDSIEAIEYDPEFLLIRPLNFYVCARKRGQWPSPSKGND